MSPPCGADPDPAQRDAVVHVAVNGEPRAFAEGATVADLLAALGSTGKPCAVEINQTVVPASTHAAHRLRDGDAIEIVGFVGGG